MRVQRLGDGPIIEPGPGIGDNINGPSLVRPGERYHLYFAHHLGDHIRLATADDVLGPWAIHPGGVLGLADSCFPTEPAASDPVPDGWTAHFPWHIASPDVHHVDGEVWMYFHGLLDPNGHDQRTRLATSTDGLRFEVHPDLLCPAYLRAFRWDGAWYGIAQAGYLHRSPDGRTPFERGPELVPSMRHAAVLVRGDVLHVFYSRWGDAPERILCSTVDLSVPWTRWRASEPVEVLRPELDWEGAGLEVRPSVPGAALEPLHELRDPCVYEANGGLYLLYSVAGERGIAIAELTL